MKGAIERVLAHCVTIGNSTPITAHHSQHFLDLAATLGNKGLRGLGSCDPAYDICFVCSCCYGLR